MVARACECEAVLRVPRVRLSRGARSSTAHNRALPVNVASAIDVASVRTAGSVTVIDVLPVVRVHQSMTVSPQGDVGATKPWHTQKTR